MAILASVWLFRHNDKRLILLVGICGGLAQLAHPDGGLLTALGVVGALLTYGVDRRRLLDTFAAGALAVGVAAPWWVPALAHGEAATLLGASTSGWSPFGLVAALGPLSNPWSLVLVGPGLMLAGAEAVLKRPRKIVALFAWWALVLAIDVRNAYMSAALPMSVLSGAGWAVASRPPFVPESGQWRRLKTMLVTIGAFTSFLHVLMTPTSIGPRARLGSADLIAMNALVASTTPGQQVAVVTGAGWSFDDLGEWFPAVTGRINAALPQGTEWQRQGTFEVLSRVHDEVQECPTIACLTRILPGVNVVYVAGPGSASAVALGPFDRVDPTASLRASVGLSEWRTVFDGPGALIAVLH